MVDQNPGTEAKSAVRPNRILHSATQRQGTVTNTLDATPWLNRTRTCPVVCHADTQPRVPMASAKPDLHMQGRRRRMADRIDYCLLHNAKRRYRDRIIQLSEGLGTRVSAERKRQTR